MKLRIVPGIYFLFLLIILAIGGTVLLAAGPIQQRYTHYSLPEKVLILDQNWSDDVRQQMNFTSFGSRLMPYDWFLNLELAASETLLRDDSVLAQLGFILQGAADNNPDGLPIGFARDRSSKGPAWIGLTCSACHMRLLTYRGEKLFIDGGPGLLDFASFESTVYTSLKATLQEPEKFVRFANRLAEIRSVDPAKLKTQLEQRLKFLDRRITANEVDVPYGYGRLDAFGQIFNAIAVEALDLPENRHVPDAPVSIPVLWDAPHLDLVQWNASAPNEGPGPLGQNATTALAVYGEVNVKGSSNLGYKNSIKIKNLAYIQTQFYNLTSPLWPVDVLGQIDANKVARGQALYEQHCLSCHTLVDRSDVKRKLKAGVIPLEQIGTDPKMAVNFSSARSKTGVLQGKKLLLLFGDRLADTARTVELVLHVTSGSLLDKFLRSATSILRESESVYSADVDFDRKAYKARPLSGIWASAPYLHNGSIPTLYDLLSPVAARPATFYVGSPEMDTVKVGLKSDDSYRASLFDTSLTGNANSGHEFATSLEPQEKWALVEYLKTL